MIEIFESTSSERQIVWARLPPQGTGRPVELCRPAPVKMVPSRTIDSVRGGQWADHPVAERRQMGKVLTRKTALMLVEEGHSYEEAGLRLGVPPGLACLAATGVPMDGSDRLSAEDLAAIEPRRARAAQMA